MQRILAGIAFGALLLAFTPRLTAQEGFFTPEDVIKYTPDWHGERFPDGRPKVPDEILDRMKKVTLEEAWPLFGQRVSITNTKMAGIVFILTRYYWAGR